MNTAKGLAMLLLEITLPSIATSLVQVFICTRFDHGAFLNEMLTLSCDNSDQRIHWVVFASLALVIYVVGGTSDDAVYLSCLNLAEIFNARLTFAHSSGAFLCDHVPPSAFDPKTGQRTTATQPASWNWAEHQSACEVKECESIVCELVDGDEVVAAKVRGGATRSLVRIPRSEHPLNLFCPRITDVQTDAVVRWRPTSRASAAPDDVHGLGSVAACTSCHYVLHHSAFNLDAERACSLPPCE